MATLDVQTAFLQPPAALLTTVTNPNTNQPDYAFPLQTAAWLKMQAMVKTALGFPLTKSNFTNLYGTFTDEATVETALSILGAIQQTANKYGDPQTLISSLPQFQTANTAPDTIYGHAVWLAAQTQLAAQQIASLLQDGLTDIGQNPDPKVRIQELTELLTGQGGVTSYATTLQRYITDFQTATSKFYDELNGELTGDTNSLDWYLKQSGNVLADANSAVANDKKAIDNLNKTIKQLNDEYIGFTVAASVSPVLILIPFLGPFIAIADATTFGILATKVKQQLEGLKSTLSQTQADYQKKSALVTQLGNFNLSTTDVDTDSKQFLDAIGTLISGWSEFTGQITLRLNGLTVADVADWSAFMTKLGFQTALDGWNLIDQKAEAFYQAGFVQFSTKPTL
jgi:hypothetical protein